MTAAMSQSASAASSNMNKKPKSAASIKNDEVVDTAAATASGKRPTRPNREEFNSRIETMNKEIDSVKADLDKCKEELNSAFGNDKNQEERDALNAQIETVKTEQSSFNEQRQQYVKQLKNAQENLNRKINEIKSTKDKLPFRSTAEIDKKLVEIDAQVSSGRLSLTEEKRMLSEASNLRKMRKNIEALGPQELAIETEKKKVDDIRKNLKALDPEHEKHKKQLDELYAKLNEMRSARSESSKQIKTLRNKRETLSKKMSELIAKRQEAYDEYKKQRSEWDSYMKEEKARKDALYKAQREEQAKHRKLESVRRAMEDAELPAYEAEIATCNALVSILETFVGTSSSGVADVGEEAEKQSVPAAREDAVLPKGVSGTVMLKKKTDRVEDDYYKPAGGKKKNSTAAVSALDKPKDKDLKFDLAVIDQFVKLKIEMPSKVSAVAKTIEQLVEKKKYFVENQERVTKENIAKAKEMEQKILKTLEEEKESNVVEAETAGQ